MLQILLDSTGIWSTKSMSLPHWRHRQSLGSLFSGYSQTSQVRSQPPIETTFPNWSKDLWLFLWRLWFCSLPWCYSGLHRLEATRSASSGCQLGASHSSGRCLGYTSRLQWLARFLLFWSHGQYHRHAPRRLSCHMRRSSTYASGARSGARRYPALQGGK